ncbi:MAG: GNAT family N-acetyltransferase [Gemmatimonadales bacterium]
MAGLIDVLPAGPTGPARLSLAARVEERLLIPAYASRWAFASISAHRTMSLPLQLMGQAQRRTVHLGAARIEVLGVGRPKLIDPLCARLFGELPAPRLEGRHLTWSPIGLTDLEADLVVAEVHSWMTPRFRRAGWLIVPSSVRWHGDVGSVPPQEPSRSLLANLAKIRKHGFSLVQAGGPADWAEFYETMVEPQARARHGSRVWIPSPDFRRKLARRATLHFVLEDGVRVAGACTIPRGDMVWFPLLGVLEGDPELLQRGASVAALALPLDWARQQNYRRFDLGRTGPFVNDGLQEYKRKWGFLPVPDPLTHFTAVWLGSDTARRVFRHQPVLVEDGVGLRTYAGETR